MTKPKPKDQLLPIMSVIIRGTVYSSADEAAKALGVKRNTVYAAIFKGRVDNVGIGTGKHSSYRKPNYAPKSVSVAGVNFKSLQELSLWLGHSKQYASNKIRRNEKGMQSIQEEVVAKKLAEQAAVTKAAYRERDREMSRDIKYKF